MSIYNTITPPISSNENLLDNPWFTVNQRGLSSYTGAVQYTVDRWKTTNANTSVYCLDRGIRIVNNTSGSTGYLLQLMEDDNRLLGKTVTFSVMLGDGRIISNSVKMPSTRPVETTGVLTLYDGNTSIGSLMFYKASASNVPLYIRIWSNSDEDERTFIAVKLELGAVSTLANDTAPDYGTELSKCQRYYTRYRILQYNRGFLGLGEDAETVIFSFSLPVTMRDRPSVSYSGDLRLYQPPNNFIKVINIVSGSYSNNKRGILFKTNGNITQNAVYELYTADTEEGIIEFNADL